LLSPLHCVTLRSQTRPSTAQKGEGQPPARCRGPSGIKKRKRPCLRFFRFRAASCRPRHNTAAAGRTMPTRIFGFPSHQA
jgi:hypothetical protein